MHWIRALWMRLRGMFGREQREREFADEMESHLQMHIDDGVRAGLSEQEARRRALIRLGGLEQAKIAHRERRGLPGLEMVLRDVAYGFRTLRKNPGFALLSILVIAVGIGANVALFTVVRSVLLRPLPFRDPARLLVLYGRDDLAKADSANVVAAGDFYDWQRSSHSFEELAIWRWTGYNMSGDRDELPEFLNAGTSSWNFFQTLGVEPVLGRSFSPEDDRPGATATAMITWAFFERRFGADPFVLGKTIRLNAKPYTVIGVLPKWFRYPDAKIQLWVPYQLGVAPEEVETHFNHTSYVIGRLKPGVSVERAAQEIGALQHEIFLRFHWRGSVAPGVICQPLIDDVVRPVRTPLLVLMAAVGCLLLIACLNLSNLLVARAAARRKEIAIRSALGSSRLRLYREQMTESLLICGAGGALGLGLAVFATRWMTMHWLDMPRADTVRPDWAVAAFATGIAFAAGILSGLLPAVSATRGGILTALQDASRAAGASASRASLRRALLTVEIALTVVLLVCAGLLFKSFLRLRSVDIGCRTKNVLTLQYFLRSEKYSEPEQIVAFNSQLLERVRHMPGVEAAGLTNVVPGNGYYGDRPVQVLEHPPLRPGESQFALFRTADPGYFSAIGIPLVRGQFFSENMRLDRDKYVIVNQELVRKFLGNEDPIGKHLRTNLRGKDGENYEIIGVVGDTPYAIGRPMRPMMWFPILSGIPGSTGEVALVVRSRSDVVVLGIPIQKLIASMDADLPVARILTMEEIVGASTANSRFSATLVLAFAGLSLLLAAVGIYGVLSYLVTQRTTEIGIRMALGARREQVLGLVLRDGLKPALLGLALGIAGSAAATQLMRSVLYATRPLDGVVYVSAGGTLLLAAALACLLPAWRAIRIDPMQALRLE